MNDLTTSHLTDHPLEDHMRGFFDPKKTRQWVLDAAKTGYQKKLDGFESKQFKLQVSNLDYEDPKKSFTLKEQQEAIMNKHDLTLPLKATVRMINKESGEVVDTKKTTLARIPWITPQNSTIINGNCAVTTCLQGNAEVWTENGQKTIKELFDTKYTGKVWCFNTTTKQFELKQVVNWFKNEVKENVNLLTYDNRYLLPSVSTRGYNTLYATASHKFCDKDGNKAPLTQNTLYITAVEQKLNEAQRQLVLGTLLGDAHIQREGVYRVGQCLAQQGYTQFKFDCLKNIMSSEVLRHRSMQSPASDIQVHSVYFDTHILVDLIKIQHEAYDKDYVKNLQSGWFQEIDERGLAFWFQDDGSVGYTGNCPYVNLHTEGFTVPDLEKLVVFLEKKWGFTCTVIRKHKQKNSKVGFSTALNRKIMLHGKSAISFLKLVAPYITEDMRYKLLKKPYDHKCVVCGCAAGRPRVCPSCLLREAATNRGSLSKSCRNYFGNSEKARTATKADFKPTKLKSEIWAEIQALCGTKLSQFKQDCQAEVYTTHPLPYKLGDASKRVYGRQKYYYDIEVSDNHNYVANGILVSNCQQRLKPGIYTRIKSTGEPEAHINVLAGSGLGGKLHFDPEKAIFNLELGSTKIRLYGILHDLGVPDADIEKAWGHEVYLKNKQSYDGTEVIKYHDHVFHK